MATTALGDAPAHTVGDLPAVGDKAPDFTLVDTDLKEFSLGDLPGRKVLSIFPSIGTGVCQAGLREFNKRAGSLETPPSSTSRSTCRSRSGTSAPPRVSRTSRSARRSARSFGDDYGVRLLDSKFEGLLARAVVILDEDDKVIYTELVPNIGQEPDYDAAVAALG